MPESEDDIGVNCKPENKPREEEEEKPEVNCKPKDSPKEGETSQQEVPSRKRPHSPGDFGNQLPEGGSGSARAGISEWVCGFVKQSPLGPARRAEPPETPAQIA
jgi:hypothetical protein